MTSELAEQKKLLLPYLQRAQEIEQVDPKVAYYCRIYALDQGLKIPQRVKEIDGLLKALLQQLERDKPKISIDVANDKFACEQFAINIFIKADKVDRAGRSDLNTSKAFYAASIFMDILNQFGEIDSDLCEKQRYALWRAAEIRKAAREGRPVQPPPGTETQEASRSFSGPSASGGSFESASGLDPSAMDGIRQLQPGPPPRQQPDDAPATDSLDAADLPSPPAVPAGVVRVKSTIGLPPPPTGIPRYSLGSKVLYRPASGAPEEGTVGKVEVASANAVPVCKVAFWDRLQEVPEAELAPHVRVGERVGYVQSDGSVVGATVLALGAAPWPPTYLLRLENGAELETDMLRISLRDVSSSVPGGTGGARAGQTGTGSRPTSAGSSAAGTTFNGPAYPSLPGTPAGASHPPPPTSTPGPPSLPMYPPTSGATAPSTSAPSPHTTSGGGAPAPRQPPPSRPPGSSTPPTTSRTPQGVVSQGFASYPTTEYVPPATTGFQPDFATIGQAQKYCKYAVSSLSFDDVQSAVKYLQDALQLLTKGKP